MATTKKNQQSPTSTKSIRGEQLSDGESGSSTLRGDEEQASSKPVNSVANYGSIEDGTAEDEHNPSHYLICYGKYGKSAMWLGVALMYIVFELDHTVLYNYENYAASEFNSISKLGALTTAGTIIVAVMKPPIAKISDVVGRVETYMAIVILYMLSYIVCATAPGFQQYAGGYVMYSVGTTGMQILNQIIVADISTSRWRGLANSLVSLPFIVIPWVAAFLVDDTLKNVGWRWGIGMFAIIMPVASIAIIAPLLYFRRRDRKEGIAFRRPTTVKSFFSAIDVIGIILLASGCGLFLLPMAVAGTVSGGWTNPWIPSSMAVGVVLLVIFGFYETKYAANPILPAKYLRSASIVLACSIGLLDAIAFQVTHTYLYAWCTVVHQFNARDATFLTYTSGCVQVLAGLTTGFLMYRSMKYKWLLIIGTIIRIIGYGVMLRLRGSANPVWELFVVQAIQGIGSGTVGTPVIVITQVVVAAAELGQATALILLSIFIGQAMGSAIAGGIYTNYFKSRLEAYLPPGTSKSLIDSVFNSITGILPARGTPQRNAIEYAYSDILRYMTILALVVSIVPFLMAWFVPNYRLNDEQTVDEGIGGKEDKEEHKKSGTTDSEDNSTAPLLGRSDEDRDTVGEISRNESYTGGGGGVNNNNNKRPTRPRGQFTSSYSSTRGIYSRSDQSLPIFTRSNTNITINMANPSRS